MYKSGQIIPGASGVISRLQHALGCVESGATDGSPVGAFLETSRLYAWILRLHFEVTGGGYRTTDFTSWFLPLELLPQRCTLEPDQCRQLLEVGRDLFDLLLSQFMTEWRDPKPELMSFVDDFTARISWRTLLRKLGWKDGMPDGDWPRGELAKCGLLAMQGLGLRTTQPDPDGARRFGESLAKCIAEYKNAGTRQTLVGLVAFLGASARYHQEDWHCDDLFQGLLNCFTPPPGDPNDLPDGISAAWYHVVRALLARKQPPSALLCEACKTLSNPVFLETYLARLSDLKGLEDYWAALLAEDDGFRDEFIETVVGSDGRFAGSANTLGMLLSRAAAAHFDAMASKLQAAFADQGPRCTAQFRCGVLGENMDRWLSLAVPDDDKHLALASIDRYLRDQSDEQTVHALEQCFLSAADDEFVRSQLYDALPLFRAYARSDAESEAGYQRYQDLLFNTHEFCNRLASETDNAHVRQLLSGLRDQI